MVRFVFILSDPKMAPRKDNDMGLTRISQQ
jgi:hypothetical protein